MSVISEKCMDCDHLLTNSVGEIRCEFHTCMKDRKMRTPVVSPKPRVNKVPTCAGCGSTKCRALGDTGTYACEDCLNKIIPIMNGNFTGGYQQPIRNERVLNKV